MTSVGGGARRTQADRRARSRAALLEATARGISQAGYGQLTLSEVAAEAGYTRGAVYHQFRDKDELVLAALEWVRETWFAEVGTVFEEDFAPVEAIVELARRHAIYCRRDIAGVMTAIRVEFAARDDHPIRAALDAQQRDLVSRVRALVLAGRRDGTIPPGPSAALLAAAILSAIEAAVITLSGRAGVDVDVAQRIARGLIA